MEYQWYEIVTETEPILQGDFLYSCPIVVPSTAIEPETIGQKIVSAKVIEYDVIIMSQSCDLMFKKLDLVLVCPIWSLDEFEKRNDFFKSKRGKEELRQGNVPGYHLLNKCDVEGFETANYLVVDFRNVYGVPFDFLTDLAKRKGKRLRLLPPYREHLSQAFARFFMRVGLPIDIPRFR
jgi:hypothetical protein